VIQDVTNYGGSVFSTMVFICTKKSKLFGQYVLHSSNIFYQSALINFNKDKKTFAFAMIIIKQLLTKQFSINISGRRSAV